jgi:hypothetical protein
LYCRFTFGDPDTWYPVNRYAGQLLLAFALVLLVVTLGFPVVLGMHPTDLAIDIFAISVLVSVLLSIAPGFRVQLALCAEIDGGK